MIGNLQGAHDTLTGIVDVAMIRSLKKKDGFHPKLKEYAQVYFDECHHAASDSAIEVLQEINAKYVYGVTATPKRGDGKEKINEFLLGPIRYRFTAKDRAEEQNINHAYELRELDAQAEQKAHEHGDVPLFPPAADHGKDEAEELTSRGVWRG